MISKFWNFVTNESIHDYISFRLCKNEPFLALLLNWSENIGVFVHTWIEKVLAGRIKQTMGLHAARRPPVWHAWSRRREGWRLRSKLQLTRSFWGSLSSCLIRKVRTRSWNRWRVDRSNGDCHDRKDNSKYILLTDCFLWLWLFGKYIQLKKGLVTQKHFLSKAEFFCT